MQSYSHVPAHNLLKTYMSYVTRLKKCVVVCFHLFLIHSLLNNTFFYYPHYMLCKIDLYSTFYLLVLSYVTFIFSCICYLSNTLNHNSNHSLCEALQVLLFLVCLLQLYILIL